MTTFLVATVFLAKWRTSHRRKANLLDNAMEARAVDSLLNYETVKYYNAENFERKKYTQAVDSFQVADWYSNSAVSLMNLGQNLIVQAGLLVGAILGAYRVYQGEMTVGDFTMLLAYITQLYVPLSWFGSYYKTIQKNFIDMEKLLDLFKEAPQVKDPEYPIPLSIPNGEVVFDNVSFAYGGQTILKNISFKVPAGSTVAIVGPSGSGKSTILRLLFRFYDVNSGRIMIDGQDIRSVLQTQLRQAIGVVPQETVLFNDTVRYNIAYGCAGNNNSVSVADVISAAKGAHIHDHIMSFVDKYETMLLTQPSLLFKRLKHHGHVRMDAAQKRKAQMQFINQGDVDIYLRQGRPNPYSWGPWVVGGQMLMWINFADFYMRYSKDKDEVTGEYTLSPLWKRTCIATVAILAGVGVGGGILHFISRSVARMRITDGGNTVKLDIYRIRGRGTVTKTYPAIKMFSRDKLVTGEGPQGVTKTGSTQYSIYAPGNQFAYIMNRGGWFKSPKTFDTMFHRAVVKTE
ncbi:ATP-binding cassette-type vacuolar membrane transporter Hmt1 [Coemansia sp. Benny D115]|nr:ATP-binding cassette-type vacuolar membrane transporter Hmt1 [Coemansia sp. Benny D115]